MRNILWTVTAIAFFATAGQAQAQNASKEETIGLGAGAVIGAIAGGPLGFVIGAGLGAKIGDDLDNSNDAIDELSSSLDQSAATVSDLESDVRSLSADIEDMSDELAQLERLAQPELLDLMQAGIAMDLLFRTDEHVLVDSTGSRLWTMARSLAAMPNVQVRLDGFADERGDAGYNLKLSQKRVEFVREQLIAAGIDESRISLTAHGEAPAQDDTVDSFALERRVSLTLYIENQTAIAAN